VESAGGRVVWVRLLVSDHEQEHRLTMDLVLLHGRAAAGKLTTARTLER
jgi:hypothetical protein